MRRVIWALAALILAAASPALAGPRAELPIKQTLLPNGTTQYSVPMTIGGVALDVMLDTGSTGLRVLPDTVPAQGLRLSSRKSTYSYTSGTQFDGVVAEADVALGEVAGKVNLAAINKVSCAARLPTCPASRVTQAQYVIGGGGVARLGYRAILGINMSPADVDNPLKALGVDHWIILLPAAGDTAPGKLILNPTDEERAGFTMFPLDRITSGQRGLFHDAINGCLAPATGSGALCGPMAFDTGAPAVVITLGPGVTAAPVSPGEQAVLVFDNGRGGRLGLRFTVAQSPGSRIRLEPNNGNPRTRMSVGTLPYSAYQVLYDSNAVALGLKAR